MKALIYAGIGRKTLITTKIPTILQPTDAIVRIKKTTICGTDLHILKGSVKTMTEGRILGHEGVGEIVERGSQVTNHAVGDQVLISCITSCGKCPNCARKFYAHCSNGGWLLGNTIDGCQAEYVRIPHANNSLYSLSRDLSEKTIDSYVMMSDILPTGLEVGVMDGQVSAGKTLAVIGAGPVGLSSIATSKVFQPSAIYAVDRDQNRLNRALDLGATRAIDNTNNGAVAEIMELTEGKGVDVVIEAIGTPTGWDVAENIVKSGGNIAILGVHGKPVTLHLDRMWYRNFTLTAGLVHTNTIPDLKARVDRKELDPSKLISHSFALSDIMQAYDVFENAAHHKALKVIISNKQ